MSLPLLRPSHRRIRLGVGLVLSAVLPVSAPAQMIPIPPGVTEGESALAAAIPEVVRRAAAAYEHDPLLVLAERARFALAGGEPREALEVLEVIKGLPSDPVPALDPRLPVLELMARARILEEEGMPRDHAYGDAFREVLAPLTDREAYEVGWYLGTPPWVFEQGFETALAAVAGRDEVPVAAALELIRTWVVRTVHGEVSPLLADLLEAEERRRYLSEDILIETPEGASLSAITFRSRTAPGPQPVILSFTIYAEESRLEEPARLAAAHGYVGVVAFARGKHRSPDEIRPYETEVDDLHGVIGWISRQSWSNGEVGMHGASYDGFAAWAATKRLHPALKTIVASAAAIPGHGLPMMNNVFLNANYAWPFFVTNSRYLDYETYGDQERWSDLPPRWYESGRPYREIDAVDGIPNPSLQRWLDHPDYDGYWQAMVPFGDDFSRIGIPVLTVTGYFDDGQLSALHYLKEHYRHNPEAEHYLVIGPYDHFTVGAPRKPGSVRGYSTDSVAQFSTPRLVFEWFDHVLRGGPRPALVKDRINYQVMGANEWRHAPSLETAGGPRLRLHLSSEPSGEHFALTPSPPDPEGALEQVVDFADRTTWHDSYYPDPVLGEAPGFTSGLTFMSEPFSEPTTITGTFSGNLRVTINKRDVDVSVTLWEMLPDGSLFHLSYFLGRASYARDMTKRSLLTPGRIEEIPFERGYMTSRRMEAGSRLLLRVDVVKDPWHQVNHGTGGAVADESAADAGEPLRVLWHGGSWVEVPMEG